MNRYPQINTSNNNITSNNNYDKYNDKNNTINNNSNNTTYNRTNDIASHTVSLSDALVDSQDEKYDDTISTVHHRMREKTLKPLTTGI